MTVGFVQGWIAETGALFPDIAVICLLAATAAVHPMAVPSKTSILLIRVCPKMGQINDIIVKPSTLEFAMN